MISEGQFDRFGFVLVAQRGRCAMCVDVLDLVGIDLGITKRRFHATGRPIAIGRGDVMRISAHAVADELAIDARSALAGMFVLFEHQNSSAFAQHETVAVAVPGPARGRGVVIAA